MVGRSSITVTAMAVVVSLSPPATAERDSSEDVRLYGDFRFRLEQDWDSRRSDGTERSDRARARIRLRLGADFRPTDRILLGARLRSGSDLSQQSPHITIVDFAGGDTGDADFNLDEWFLKARSSNRRFSGWVGRDGFPFWKQNELFWDDDVTLAGMAGSLTQKTGDKGELAIHAGWFSLPAGMRDFAGEMRALQLVYSAPIGDVNVTVAGGYFVTEANPADAAANLLLNGDGVRDYRVLVGNLQAKLQAGGRALTFGADVLTNREAYSATDPVPFTVANAGQTDGRVFSARYGSTSSRGDWLAGYFYARIEALAVIASYAQDDWVRWGNGPQTRGSNFHGHELRFAYAASRHLKVVARLYIVESITTVEDGNRFRIDFNFKLGKDR